MKLLNASNPPYTYHLTVILFNCVHPCFDRYHHIRSGVEYSTYCTILEVKVSDSAILELKFSNKGCLTYIKPRGKRVRRILLTKRTYCNWMYASYNDILLYTIIVLKFLCATFFSWNENISYAFILTYYLFDWSPRLFSNSFKILRLLQFYNSSIMKR